MSCPAELHLVLHSDNDGADVLTRVPGDREHDDADEGLVKARYCGKLGDDTGQVPGMG